MGITIKLPKDTKCIKTRQLATKKWHMNACSMVREEKWYVKEWVARVAQQRTMTCLEAFSPTKPRHSTMNGKAWPIEWVLIMVITD